MPSQLDVDKIRHTNGTDALTFDSSGNTNLQKDLKFSSTAAIKNSAGNNILSESGGTITLTTNSAVIEGSSSGNLVRITQTGTGNALVVEDSTNPDSTPFVINASGVVGIGTSSPNEMMTIASSSVASYLQICDSSTGSTSGDGLFLGSFNGAAELRTKENTHLSFGTNNTQHMRIDSNGNVGIGTILPQDGLDVAKNARIGQGQISADSTVGVLGIYGGLAGNTTNSQLRFFGKSVSNTGGTYEIARISGSSFGPYALSGGIQFSTASNDGANNLTLTERMRIDSSGNVGIGTSNPGYALHTIGSSDGTIAVFCNAQDNANILLQAAENYGSNNSVDSKWSIRWRGRTNAGGHSLAIYDEENSAERMRIDGYGNVNINNLGTGTVYSNSGTLTNTNPSDLNLKENVVEVSYGLSEVKQLRPVEFDWIADEADKHELGFIAQEVQLIIPDLVNTYERIIDEETGETEIGYGLESTQFIPVLVKAMQEQQTLIESQQSQIDTLTAKTQEQDLTIASLISRIEALETN